MQCIICLNDCSKDAIICESTECATKSMYTYMLDNYVSDFFKKSKNEFMLIMSLAHTNALSGEFKNKYPIDMTNVNDVTHQANTFIENTDEEIISKHGLKTYQLIKFLLKNALMEFGIVEKIIDGIQTYEFVYSDVINTQFVDSSYLFHGSPIQNWYSIIENGLKVFSKTKKMRHGASFGSGIYLSDAIDTSLRYTDSTSQDRTVVVGVFEVLGDIKTYVKSSNIFVVPDDKKLRLKYLIVVANDNKKLYRHGLSNYFTKDKNTLVKKTTSYVNKMKNKRLMMEINNIMKQQIANSISDFKLLEMEEVNIWNVLLINIDKDTKLYSDMVLRGIDNIHIEIRFESSYPMSPPFVRIIKPAIQRLTGHVTQGGSICAEVLTNQGWSPAINMESLIITIKAIISEDGRLGGNHKYSLEAAKNSYSNMLKVHGWQ